ncbi:NAD kinase [Rubellimicrobium mesophilum DSM 19309]|uniref:NAD kinase n=2 Tax=Rubellimicrobium TaxID=295418 RepID=A0A017HM69_9RHOB|nr:NAD kinase [Rubellimicrobium mesophilum DSM 19309]
MGAAEELLRPLDRQALGQVHELAAPVVAPPRIALRILVGQHRALRLQNRPAHDVLGGDQLDLVALPAQLGPNGRRNPRVALRKWRVEEALVQHPGDPCQSGCGLIAATRHPGESQSDAMADRYATERALAFRIVAADNPWETWGTLRPMPSHRICFVASDAQLARAARDRLAAKYGEVPLDQAAVVVALGGDGFMLQTLHAVEGREVPVYGMNRGTVGFLMNAFREGDLRERIDRAEHFIINPLRMRAAPVAGGLEEALAINEVSLLRMGPQAAKLRVSVDGRVRIEELVCDGALVATPAGSTAYNYSAHGPVLPIGAEVLALTAIAPFRPRRWRGALIPKDARVRFDVVDPEKRPVRADADSRPVQAVAWVEVASEPAVRHHLLFDPGHGLDERLIREQFA